MNVDFQPGELKGTIQPPRSKSYMQRCCAAALLHRGTTIIHFPAHSEDDEAALQLIQDLGAVVVARDERQLVIHSSGIPQANSLLHCGESGLSARLFAPIIALCNQTIHFHAKGSLLHRPMDELITSLQQLGVSVESRQGKFPLVIQGPIKPTALTVSGAVSSQFITGLLFALSSAATEPIVLAVTDLKSRPYVDMTLSVLAQFGKPVQELGQGQYLIDAKLFQTKETIEFTIPCDWSSAANWLVGAAINGSIVLNGMQIGTHQADEKILSVLHTWQCMDWHQQQCVVKKASKRLPFELDLTHAPDLFPILAILAATAQGTSKLVGLHRLLYKESNRKASILDMLDKLGVVHHVDDDCLVIDGANCFRAATFPAYKDHRMVMAVAIASLYAEGILSINGADAVRKSYPDFFTDLSSLGLVFQIQ